VTEEERKARGERREWAGEEEEDKESRKRGGREGDAESARNKGNDSKHERRNHENEGTVSRKKAMAWKRKDRTNERITHSTAHPIKVPPGLSEQPSRSWPFSFAHYSAQ
jgi:hypothetical protein